MLFVSTFSLLAWCDTSNIIDIDEWWDDLALNIIKKLDHQMGKKWDIKSENIRWLDHTNIFWENNEIPWYSVSYDGVAYDKVPNIDRYFDGWHLEYVWDGIASSVLEYRKDWVACYIGSYLEQDIPYELVNREDDYTSDYWDAWDEFLENATYEIVYECANLPEQALNYEDRYFDVITADAEAPYWSASIRWSALNVFDEYWVNGDYYFSEFAKDANTVTFMWYDNKTTIIEQSCTDYAGRFHNYSVQMSVLWDEVLEWCADKVDLGLVLGEQWFITTLNEKVGLEIPWSTDTRYEVMDMLGNYVHLSVENLVDDEYEYEERVLEREPNWWRVIYQWDYNVSPEKCEELTQYDWDLMDMSVFYNCPRG